MAPQEKKARIGCSKPGCSGTCPLQVVERTSRPGSTPAKCFECGKVFRAPPGTNGRKDEAAKAAKENKALRAECERLKKLVEKEKEKQEPTTGEAGRLQARSHLLDKPAAEKRSAAL